MPLQYAKLKLFRSVLLAEAAEIDGEPAVDAIIDGVITALSIDSTGSPFIRTHRQPGALQGSIAAAFIHFEEWRTQAGLSTQA